MRSLVATAIFSLFLAVNPAQAAAGDPISFSEGSFLGKGAASAESIVGGNITPGRGSFAWNLVAQQAIVNWSRETVLEVAKPHSPDEWLYRRGQGSTAGETILRNASLRSDLSKPISSLLLDGNGSRLEVPTGYLNIRFAPAAGPTIGIATNWSSFVKTVEVPAQLVSVAVHDGRVAIYGNFSVFVWESSISARSESGRHEFRSGSWTEGAVMPTVNDGVRLRHFQIVRIDVTDGALNVNLESRPFAWVSESLDVAAEGSFLLRGPDQRIPVRATAPTDGRAPAQGGHRVLNATMSTGHLPRLELTVWQGAVAGTGDLAQSPALALPEQASGVVALIGAAIACSMAIAVALVRGVLLAPASIDEVEYFLVTRKWARASKLARLRIRADPADAENWFLYGCALLGRGRYTRILEELPTAWAQMEDQQRSSLALLMSLAAEKLDLKIVAANWRHHAGQNPRPPPEADHTPVPILVPDSIIPYA